MKNTPITHCLKSKIGKGNYALGEWGHIHTQKVDTPCKDKDDRVDVGVGRWAREGKFEFYYFALYNVAP